MQILVFENAAQVGQAAATLIAAQVLSKPDSILGLATGSTPIGTYQQLIEMYKAGDISFKEVTTVNLDEYKGLSGDHDQSYRYFMNDNLFNHVDIDKDFTFVPNGLAEDAEEECTEYDKIVAALGYADLQLLGIGHNGHIGFNEPDTCFTKATHVVDLTDSTIDANTRFFANRDEVPRQALTMGMGCIMNAARVLLIASGAGKADAVYNTVCGPIDPQCPATILQLHPDVVIVGDEAALSKLIEAGIV